MSASDVYILGINAYDHDVSACLLRNGRIEAAISKERLTRVKHDTGYYGDPVDYCLFAAGIWLDRVDLVVRNSYVLPVEELEERLIGRYEPAIQSAADRKRALASPLFRAGPPRVVTCSHHLAHAYSAFAASPFASGACMIVDGVGSYRQDVLEPVPEGSEAPPLAREAESYYRFDGTEIETLRKVWLEPQRGFVNDEFFTMGGLGAFYSRVSTYIFGHWNRCGEVMGLAPYGRPTVPPLVEIEDGELRIAPWPEAACEPFTDTGDPAWNATGNRQHWEDVAWRVQHDTEEALLARARWLHEVTGAENLTLAGGVALNCVANGRLVRETPFRRVFIQPAAGDDGIAIGCAYYGHLALRGGERPEPLTHAYLGRAYSDAQVEAAARRVGVRISASATRPPDVLAAAADRLARGAVLGWFQGRSEFGPRALGNRSILADPRDPGMADRVNRRIKHRQPFRPFAPVVLAERAHEYFELDTPSPFMLLAARVRPEVRDRIPAVVHVDGTARVQTVHQDTNPRLHALLTAFAERTGVPVLLNTSFNDRGEPIVETPSDAVDCFLATELDALVMHDALLEKRAIYRALRPFLRAAVKVRRRLGPSRLQALADDG